MSLSGSVTRSSPSNETVPPSMWPAGFGSSRIRARFVTLLPQPDSPTRPSVSPWLESTTPVDGEDRAFVGPEPDDEVPDLEKCHRQRRSRGSSDSRNPSPTRLKPIALMTIARPGK